MPIPGECIIHAGLAWSDCTSACTGIDGQHIGLNWHRQPSHIGPELTKQQTPQHPYTAPMAWCVGLDVPAMPQCGMHGMQTHMESQSSQVQSYHNSRSGPDPLSLQPLAQPALGCDSVAQIVRAPSVIGQHSPCYPRCWTRTLCHQFVRAQGKQQMEELGGNEI